MKVVIQGILTNYEIIGRGEKTLVILHGWQRSIVDWLPFAKSISDSYRVVLLDLPGFGTTPRPTNTFDTYDYARFVKDFLHKTGILHYSLLGHSFGGRLCIILASETNNISKLVLVDSAGIEAKTFEIKLKIYLFKLFIKPFKKLSTTFGINIKSLIGSHDYKKANNMRDIFVKVVNQDLSNLIPKILVKTLIVWGDKDEILPVNQTKKFKQIPNSAVKIVWGAGHSPHIEKPGDFTQTVKEFLC
ncbi:alpha/beta hydrolase [candidate division WWE3 bacterium]|nr:alpha/beta hydrolase [candidate division WWE3 bacterium]